MTRLVRQGIPFGLAVLAMCVRVDGQTVTYRRIVDGNTPVPGRDTVFATFVESDFGSPRSAIDQGRVAFHGRDADGHGGVYLWDDGDVRVIADFDTPFPGSRCDFGKFGGIDQDAGLVAFRGGVRIGPPSCFDVSVTSGVFGYDAASGGFAAIADNSMAVPGRLERFNGFGSDPAVRDGVVLFAGNWRMAGDSTPLSEIYRYEADAISLVFPYDTVNPVTGTIFGAVGQPISFWGDDLAFASENVFLFTNGEVRVVAQSGTPVPGGTGHFVRFNSGEVQLADGTVIFLGNENEEYAFSPTGVYLYDGQGLSLIADRNTIMPGTDATPVQFNNLSGDGRNVVFRVRFHSPPHDAVYALIDGRLVKVVDASQVFDDQHVLFTMWPDIDGRQVSFVARFTDRTEALYVATVENICGDGVVEPGEQCDDGNRIPGDGCSETCQVEGEPGGCSPGFWRQRHHVEYWEVYDPGDTFDEVFGVDAFGPEVTLSDALWRRGGRENALGRHAVAALLNATRADVAFVYTVDEVIAMVQEAYATGGYEEVKDRLELENELGCTVEKQSRAGQARDPARNHAGPSRKKRVKVE